MFLTRNNSNHYGGSTTSMPNANTRRAFRDVTNANRNGNKDAESKPLLMQAGNEKRPGFLAPNLQGSNTQQPSRVTSNIRATILAGFGLENESLQVPVATESFDQVRLKQQQQQSYQYTGKCDNIDERNKDDPLCVTDYVQDMYDLFRKKEKITSVLPVYMDEQSHINERMRAILVDWLVEVHLKFKLVPETLYLTVNLIDRYLERQEVTRSSLQLVGVTCLLIASKYEEIYPPGVHDLVYICDRAYTRREIIKMEEQILNALEYKITMPSAHTFLVRYLKAAHADKEMAQLACYILDGTLQSYNLLHFVPSKLAAAAVFLARHAMGRNPWSPTLLKYTEYLEEEIVPVACEVLEEKNTTPPELRSIKKKYSHSRFGCVADRVFTCDF